ncbi:hypothetical protein GCM10018783_38790 [Streptomyces griseosporeus]|nr:hypothetical protein GCM10018783_38790 [Streptomyces griseosporeus]
MVAADPVGVPLPPDDAHTPRPTPRATVPANAAATIPRLCLIFFAGARRLCWLTSPTYDPRRVECVHHTF